MATTTTTTTTTTLNVVSLPVSLAPATGSFSGPACIILNTTGATLSQVQQQHPQLLVNSNNEKDYHQTQHLQQQQQEKPQLDRNHHHHHNNNNNNNININNIGTTANNGTVVGVVGVGELVGLVGVGPPVVNVPACPTSTAATVTTNILAAPPTSETSTSTAAVALRLTADPPVTIPAVLRPVSAPAPITTNVTTSNVILNVSRVLNNHSTTTTTTTTNNNHNFKSYNNNNINNINNHANDTNNNFSHINHNNKKMRGNISKTSCVNGFVELPPKPLLPTLQQPYQQNQNQHQPELLRCKRRIDFSGLGFTLPRAQPAAVARRNERERNRVKLVNLGFEALREHVPNGRKNKKMSKVETLRAAVQYIKELQELLHHEPDFLDISDLEVCAAAAAAAAQLTSSVSVADSTVSTCITSKSISPPPNSDISCSPSSSLCSDSGSSCDPFNEDDLIDFSRLL